MKVEDVSLVEALKDSPEDFCYHCKHLKYFFHNWAGNCEIFCKKGKKEIGINKEFVCGQYKPKRRK